jgi:hypothetical protein
MGHCDNASILKNENGKDSTDSWPNFLEYTFVHLLVAISVSLISSLLHQQEICDSF